MIDHLKTSNATADAAYAAAHYATYAYSDADYAAAYANYVAAVAAAGLSLAEMEDLIRSRLTIGDLS